MYYGQQNVLDHVALKFDRFMYLEFYVYFSAT